MVQALSSAGALHMPETTTLITFSLIALGMVLTPGRT